MEARPPPPPPRPLVGAALAVAAGTWLGARHAGLAAWLGPLSGLAAGILWSRAARPRPGPAPATPEAAGAPEPSRGSRGAGGPGALALALLAGLAAWRASPPDTPSSGEAALASGRIEARFEEGTLRARLGGLELEGEGHLARDGELVRLLPAEPPVPAPRAPPPIPSAAPRLEVAPDQVVRLAPGGGSLAPFEALRARWIRALGALPSPAAAALAPAVLFGDTSGVTAEQSDLFVRTGTRHLLAVSGANVSQLALLASLPAWLASRATGRRWRWARPLAALMLLLYIPFAGGGSPVKRAAIAFALASLAPLLPARGGARGRRADPLSLLACAFLLEGLVNPRGLGALGTQLSYAATLGLVLFARPFARALARALARDIGSSAGPRRAGSPPGWPRLVAMRAARLAALALAASLAAVLATLPISWAHFGEWCPAGIALTPLALPLVAWLLGAAAIHVLAPIAAPAGAVALPAELLVGLLELADALPGTPSPLPWRPAWTLVLAAGLTLAAGAGGMGGMGAPPAPAAARAAALAWALLIVPWRAAPAELELVALDVGHGTAVALRGPGLGTWVFDAGSRDRRGVARRALGPWLATWEAGALTVVLSHDDRDHASELGWLVERYPPERWVGALPAPLLERLPHTAEHVDLAAGELALTAAGPIRARLVRGLAAPGNEGSRALALGVPGGGVWLLGDAEGEGLAALLRQGSLRGPTDVLLAPHHGSESPWIGKLLARTRPREVWVSGSVAPPIGSELARRGIPCRSTALEGPLQGRIHPGGPPVPPGGLPRRHGVR